MPSPRRIFRSFTTAQIQQLLDSGFNRAIYGQFTSLSGGGKSASFAHFDMETLFFEASYELGIRNRTGSPTKVTSILTETGMPSLSGGRGYAGVVSGGTSPTEDDLSGDDGAEIDFTALPTEDPHILGRLWNNGGVVMVSAG